MRVQAQLELPTAEQRRGSPRRKLSLGVNLGGSGDPVIIRDFSTHGMLIESAADLPLFDGIEIDLPEAGKTFAIIVWNSGRYYGCEFSEPVSKASVSAALLQSQPRTGATPAERRPLSVVRANGTEAFPAEDSSEAVADEEAPLSVRLRVILGAAILLWSLIVGTIWGLSRLAADSPTG
ncbi:MAG: PilZ domain-containing protein [Sphingomicrobium sp.]